MARRSMATRLRSALAGWALALSLASLGSVAVAEAAEMTFVLPIKSGRVPEGMRLIRVKRNDVVKLQWTTDKVTSIHLHGYDIEQKIVPGAVTEMTFTAHATGRFTIEPHVAKQSSGGHVHGNVLVTIEVHP